MKSFLEEYGFAILAAIVVILLIMMISPVGIAIRGSIKSIVFKLSNTTETSFDSIDILNNKQDEESVIWEGTVYTEWDTETGVARVWSMENQNSRLLMNAENVKVIYDGVEYESSVSLSYTSYIVGTEDPYDFSSYPFLFYYNSNEDRAGINTQTDGEHTLKITASIASDSHELTTLFDGIPLGDETIVGDFSRIDVGNIITDFSVINHYSHVIITIDHDYEYKTEVYGDLPTVWAGVNDPLTPSSSYLDADVGISYTEEDNGEGGIVEYNFIFIPASDPSMEFKRVPHILIQVDENDRLPQQKY